MVSTITEDFFVEHFQSQGKEQLQQCTWLQLKAANGLGIPYIGYLELDVSVLGKTLPRMGVLVVKSPEDPHTRERKLAVPGLLGMNIIQRCYQELFIQLGPDLFKSPQLKAAGPGWKGVLSECHSIKLLNSQGYLGVARVQGRSVCVPAGSMKFLSIVCPTLASTSLPTVILEPLEDGSCLPSGLLVSKALLRVVKGIIEIPVVNVGRQDVWLRSNTPLGSLHVVQTKSPLCSVTLMDENGSHVAVIQSIMADSHQPFDLASVSWPTLSPEQEQQGKALLQKYQHVFSQGDGDLGCTSLVEHEVHLTDDIPIRQRYRRLPPSQYDQVKIHIQELLSSGIVRPSSSPYASPIVVVKKKDGSIRLCVDYRLLNAKTRKDAYPLPRIEESLDALGGAKWFSTLDLASGYNQVPVAERDKPKTAFCTPFGLFEFNRMPFGMCNSPSTFQRLMERIFGDQSLQSLLLYLDDIVIFSATFKDHLQRLELVLTRLQEQHLKLKLKKCHFFQHEVKYLGHIVSAAGVATDPDKISVVTKWQRPTTVRELQSFLGFASYYRRFVEGFSKMAAPLHGLIAETLGGKHKSRTHGKCLLSEKWNEQCEQAFQLLKQRLVSAPVLGYADFAKPFILEIDASHAGLGAVLSQELDGQRRPIAFASRGLRRSERNMSNYSARKLELLALKWAVTDKFREYLFGNKCTVFTDNNPLSYLKTAKLGAVEQRWVAELAVFDFEVKYRPGSTNRNADALSRQPANESSDSLTFSTQIPCVIQQQQCQPQVSALNPVMSWAIQALPAREKADLRALQEADPVVGAFKGYWLRGTRPSKQELATQPKGVSKLVQQWHKICTREEVLYRRIRPPRTGGEILQLLLPESLKGEVLQHLHDGHGHQGAERTTHLVRERCFWPNMWQEIEDYCRRCSRCLVAKANQPKVRTFPGNIIASHPLEILAIDFTAVDKSGDGRENMLVMTDVFSKFTQAFPTPDQKATTTARILTEKWFYLYGVPKRIHSDQGRNFEGELMKQLCKIYGIEKSRTTPYHPEGNGQCERSNRTIHDLLRSLPPEKKRKWPQYLPQILFAYNTTEHASTSYSPYELMFGQKARLPVDFLLAMPDNSQVQNSPHEWVLEHERRLRTSYDHTRAHLQGAAERRNRQVIPNVTDMLAPGTLVLKRNHLPGRHKIQDVWDHTIYEIVQCLDGDGRVYKIRPQNGTGPDKHIHRAELKVIPSGAMAHTPDPTSSDQNSSSRDREEDPAGEETDLPSVVMVNIRPLPSERPQRCHPLIDASLQSPASTMRPDPKVLVHQSPISDDVSIGPLHLTTTPPMAHDPLPLSITPPDPQAHDPRPLFPTQSAPQIQAQQGPIQEEVLLESPLLRRSHRATAGHHPNPFNLPQSACKLVEQRGDNTVTSSHQGTSQTVYASFRPWL